MTTEITRRSALAGLSAFAAAPAFAHSGGSTITLMHGFTPGTNVDIVARLIADQFGNRLNRRSWSSPRPGAGGTTSAAAVARADPDGTTFDHPARRTRGIGRDLQAASVQCGRQLLLHLHADGLPVHPRDLSGPSGQTVADVINSAQADPGKLSCATAGNGTGMHLAFEFFIAMAGSRSSTFPTAARHRRSPIFSASGWTS